MPIPGLENIPIEESPSTSGEGVQLTSFDMKTFTVPDSHRSGKCRNISEFNKISHVGEGAFGSVYKVIDLKSNQIVALKKLKIGCDEMTPMALHFIREITILKSLNHSNIVRFEGICVGRNFESTYLILEYCPYSLAKVIDDSEAKLQSPEIKCIMAQLFAGLAYIHDKFVIHRDLSVTNILFTESGVMKISDMGFARLCSTSEMTPNVVSRWTCGSPVLLIKYRAPELLFGSKTYTSAIDMWAAGCILAELLLKKPLFPADSDNDMIKLIIDCIGTPTEASWPGFSELPLLKSYDLRLQPYNRLRQHFANQSGTCISLLHKLFTYNPATRYTAKSSLRHTYFVEEPHACSTTNLVTTLKMSETI